MIANDSGLIVGASFESLPPVARSYAVGDAALAAHAASETAPSYGVLSTGEAALINDPGQQASFDLGGGSVRGDSDFDVTVLRVDLDVPAGANYLSFDFQFLSEEFPQLDDDLFNDGFIAELDSSTWTTSGSQITAPNNFAVLESGSQMVVGELSHQNLSPLNAAGTAFDGSGIDPTVGRRCCTGPRPRSPPVRTRCTCRSSIMVTRCKIPPCCCRT